MNLIDRCTMHLCFGGGKPAERRERIPFCRRLKAAPLQELANRPPVAVGRVGVDMDLKRGANDRVAFAMAEMDMKAGESEVCERVFNGRRGNAEVDQGGDDHVSGESARGIQVEDLSASSAGREVAPPHRIGRNVGRAGTVVMGMTVVMFMEMTVVMFMGMAVVMFMGMTVVMFMGMTVVMFMGMTVIVIVVVIVAHTRPSAPRAAARSIRATANAAPNPLSMFVTVTPEAQLVSIPQRAAIPPKAAP